ncbi:MAG: hypothetical protein LBT75_04695 [Bacilli bacterium]|jgi:hypothetical protein|nr:hypothetical protein [Bacilli bacterium]
MIIIISQIIVLCIILAMFYLAFKNDKSKFNVSEIAMVALFCVIIAVLSRFLSIKFPPAQPIFVISFASAISISLGLLINVKLAIVAGLITDLIGVLIAPAAGDNSMPFLGFTLTAILAILLPCLLYRATNKFNKQILNIIIVFVLGFTVLFAGIYLFNVSSLSIDQNKTMLNDGIRYIILFSLIVIAIIICLINFWLEKKIVMSQEYRLSISQLSLIVLCVEVVCHIILTSLWVNIMYGVPFMLGMSTRMIKAILMLPLNILVISLIITYIPKQFKKHLLFNKDEQNDVTVVADN